MAAAVPVQACITAVGFPETLEELDDMVADNAYVRGALTDIDTLLLFRPSHGTSWTAPRWMTAADLLFFYHTDRGCANVARLRRQVRDGARVGATVARAIERAHEQAARFGGSIFACAVVSDRPAYESDEDGTQHFRSTVFAPLGTVYVLPNPVPRAEFSRAVALSRGGTLTPVRSADFGRLKTTLAALNALPDFLQNAVGGDVGLRDVTPATWPAIVTRRGLAFLDEGQIRSYLIDHLLSEVKDPRTPLLKECDCVRDGAVAGTADYMVRVHGEWVPVEAKLNVRTERDLPRQLRKYIAVDAFRPTVGDHAGRVFRVPRQPVCLVADQAGVYVTVNGSYVGCSASQPAWPRTELTHDSAADTRERLASMSRARVSAGAV